MERPSKLAHVVYMTRRYDQMLNWYQTVFEAKVQYQNPAFAFLTYDDEHHRFAFVNMSVLNPDGVEMDATSKVGVNHVGYTFSNVGELLETYERLKEAGITPYWRVHHGVSFQFIIATQTAIVWSFKSIAVRMRRKHTLSCTAMHLQ